MKKMETVRQNRCDREMNVILFWIYFLFFAMQLFIVESDQPTLVNWINMSLYLLFVPGFLFRTGYHVSLLLKSKDEEIGKREILRTAGLYFCIYGLLAVLQLDLLTGYGKNRSFYYVITFLRIPAMPAVFLAVAIALVLSYILYNQLRSLFASPKKMMITAAVLVLCSMLKFREEAYQIAAALFGAGNSSAVPVIPYLTYFLLGAWFEDKKPGFNWRLAAAAAGITAVSAVLYRTPLQDIARLLISIFPVYGIYLLSEGFSELTLRFSAAKFVTKTTEIVFAVYALLLFAVKALHLFENPGVKTTLLLAAGTAAALYLSMTAIWAFSKICQKFIAGWQGVKHKRLFYFFSFTIVFALLCLIVFFTFIRYDRTLIWTKDGVAQYYPRAVYYADTIRNMLKEFRSGNFTLPMYDFRLGLGGEVTFSLEPLYVLFALFGREHLEFAYNLITIIRFYLAGLAFSAFCFYFKKDYFTTFISSCVYVFCGFSLYGGARHTMFMIPMIMFPLLILSMEEIIRKKRWYLCTIFVALSLFSNYYYLYMCTFGMGIYFLVRFFCQKDRTQVTWKNFLGRGFTIAGSYLLGVAMSCIVLVTTFGLYVGSGRNGMASISTPSLFYYGASWIVKLFMSFPVTTAAPGNWLRLGFLPIAFFAVLCLFLKKGRKELKILCAVSFVLLALPLTGFVLNGFSSVSNRWCFMLALLIAYITADVLPDLQELSRRDLLILGLAAALYGYFALYGNIMVNRYTKIAFLALGFTWLCILLAQKRVAAVSHAAKQSILLLMTVLLVFVNSYTLYDMENVVKEYTKTGDAQALAENTPLRAVSELGDDSFYRVTTPKLNYRTISSSMMFDYNSVTMFNSTINSSIMEYLEKMGSTGYSATQLLGLSNRTFLGSLAALKYYAYYSDANTRELPYGYETVLETELDGKDTTVCENQYALPIGYTYSSAISREELESYDTVQRQEVLMQKVMLEDIEEQGTEDVQSTLESLEYKVKTENGLHLEANSLTADGFSDGEESVSMEISFRSVPNSETYLVLKNAVLPGDGSEEAVNITFTTESNTLTYKFRPDDDRYGTHQEDYVFNLGYNEEEITGCTISFSRDAVITFEDLEVCSQPMKEYPNYVESLSEDVLENAEITGNTVSGTISLEEEKILVLSIPYQKGWTAYVDGEEAELQRANYMYMAIPLSKGAHTVRLEYEIPGVKYALVIMPSSVVILIVLMLAGKIRNKIRKSREK